MISVKESGYNGDNNLLAVKRVLILKNLIWRADKKMIQIVEHSAKHKKGGSFQAAMNQKTGLFLILLINGTIDCGSFSMRLSSFNP